MFHLSYKVMGCFLSSHVLQYLRGQSSSVQHMASWQLIVIFLLWEYLEGGRQYHIIDIIPVLLTFWLLGHQIQSSSLSQVLFENQEWCIVLMLGRWLQTPCSVGKLKQAVFNAVFNFSFGLWVLHKISNRVNKFILFRFRKSVAPVIVLVLTSCFDDRVFITSSFVARSSFCIQVCDTSFSFSHLQLASLWDRVVCALNWCVSCTDQQVHIWLCNGWVVGSEQVERTLGKLTGLGKWL